MGQTTMLLLAVACLAAIASAAEVETKLFGSDDMSRGPEKKGCCTPDQWEGVQASTTGYVKGIFRRSGIERGYVFVSYDFTNQRTAAFANYTGSAGRRSYKIVRRYRNNTGRLYVVDRESGKCYQKKLEKPFRPACIPAEAETIGPFYYGAGAGKLESVGYLLKMAKGRKLKLESMLVVTQTGCIPVGELVTGKAYGVSMMENVGFVNISPGIKDPAVFDVPDECDDAVPGLLLFELTTQHKHLSIL